MFLRMSMPEPPELIAFKAKLAATSTADASCVDLEHGVDPKANATQGKGPILLSTRLPYLRLLKGYWDRYIILYRPRQQSTKRILMGLCGA